MVQGGKKVSKAAKEAERKYRNFPKHTIEAALVLPQKIQDEMGGAPMKRLLLADALGLSPSSTNFRDLLSSSFKYGLTEGTEKAPTIALTDTGADATQAQDQARRLKGLRRAALTPSVFQRFFQAYSDKKLPSAEMLPKILTKEYGVPATLAEECATYIGANGRFVDVVREIGGSRHVLLDTEPQPTQGTSTGGETKEEGPAPAGPAAQSASPQQPPSPAGRSESAGSIRPIFIGHGKNKAPLQQLQKFLSTFQIPHKVVVDEPNLGRPIPQKVRDTMEECGSAILIFTRDERFFDDQQQEVWRPSENVVHELGASAYAYGDRIVIFKEKGVHFPTNFQSIGYIEFETDDLQARTAELLKELIGFGLVKITTS